MRNVSKPPQPLWPYRKDKIMKAVHYIQVLIGAVGAAATYAVAKDPNLWPGAMTWIVGACGSVQLLLGLASPSAIGAGAGNTDEKK